jgi:hypothetical protein
LDTVRPFDPGSGKKPIANPSSIGNMACKACGMAGATWFVMDNNINKASVSLLAMAALVIAAIAAKIRATIDTQAPVGYEDEAGFHFGNGGIGE